MIFGYVWAEVVTLGSQSSDLEGPGYKVEFEGILAPHQNREDPVGRWRSLVPRPYYLLPTTDWLTTDWQTCRTYRLAGLADWQRTGRLADWPA